MSAPVISGCGSSGDAGALSGAKPVIENYAQMVRQGYTDSLVSAQAIHTAVAALVTAPSDATLIAARQAWLDAREFYGQTEVYRFYDGPIDGTPDGPEPFINGWPLDEVYIDYVVGQPDAGIINMPDAFPTLTAETIAAQNEQGGEKNISTGYHAIEFLLWGQDLSATGPGARPFTDYVSGAGGTAANADRRAQYLTAVTDLLVSDLQMVVDAWSPDDASDYDASFLAVPAKEAVTRMLTGMGSLAGAELSGERMRTAYDNKDQEDEHSCFSDNTLRDLHNNALGIDNVYFGRYGGSDGPGLDELVRAADPALDAQVQQQLADMMTAIDAIPAPFDQALLGADDSPGRMSILAAIQSVQTVAESVAAVADRLGIMINLE